MNRREAAKQLVVLYAKAILLGVYDDDGISAEVVALAVAALLKEESDGY